jgi:hypothetical protein
LRVFLLSCFSSLSVLVSTHLCRHHFLNKTTNIFNASSIVH